MNRNIFERKLMTSSIREMNNFIAILFPFLLLISCERKKSIAVTPPLPEPELDSSVTFSVIEKDSAYSVSYILHRIELEKGTIIFAYTGSVNSFTLWCDTARKICKEFTQKDTIVLDLEKERTYEVNGKTFQVLRLVANKNATDGEMLYFLDSDKGLLITKSVTWRLGEIINPEPDSKDYIRLTALLFNILTDEDEFKRPPPVNKIKFTVPKIE